MNTEGGCPRCNCRFFKVVWHPLVQCTDCCEIYEAMTFPSAPHPKATHTPAMRKRRHDETPRLSCGVRLGF